MPKVYRSRAYRRRYYARVYRYDGRLGEVLSDMALGLLIGVPASVLMWLATLWLVFR